MEGNIVGEPFDDFVKNQIKIRQSNQFGGYGTSLRTNDQLQYLSNRNAWVKLASSVDVLEGNIVTPLQNPSQPTGNTGTGATNGGFNPSGGYTSGTNFGNTGTGFPQSPTGAVPGLTNVQSTNYKAEKLRQIGIKDPEKYSGTKLAEKAILFNSISSFDSINTSYSSSRAGVTNINDLWSDSFAYGIGGTDYGIQPPPGITGATVDSINRGSIRKANVTLKAHNKFQFDIIELLYLRLGFTMMLEWGWDKYLDSETGDIKQVENTIIEEKWFTTSTGISQLQMLGYIQETREKYDGNYDGFFGKVSNFTWNFNPDGTYDIAIDLITVGDVIESLKVNTVAKQKLGEVTAFADPTGITEKFYGPNVTKASLLNSLGAFLFAKIDYMVQTGVTGLTSNVGGLPSLSYAAIRINESAIVLNSGDSRAADNLQKYFYYVRLGTFLAELQNLIVPQIQNGTSTTPQLYISYDAFSNLISYFPNQISFDPKVCIFQFSDSLNSYGDITGINSPFLGSGNVPLDSYLQVNQGLTHGMLMNLYINIEFLSELLVSNGGPDQELSLFKFMQDLCNGINNALGGVNKLEPVIKDDSTLVIIDQTLSVSVEDTVKLEVYGYNPNNQVSNFVKDVKFVSKITPQFASMVSIGATAAGSSTSEIDGTAFSKWSEGLVDRFTQKILEPLVPPAAPVSGSADREFYRKIYIRFRDANPSILQNFYKIIGVIEKDSVLKKINDPYYSTLYLKVMGFETFFAAASKFDEEQRAKGIFKPGEVTNLVDKNYAFYLANAFGGIVTSVLIAESETGDARNPFATQTTYTHPEISPGQARYFEYNDTFISQGKAVYKNYITALNNNRFAATNTPSSEIGFIPLSFDLILEGISGIKIYNKLSINNNFLPSNYPESLNFIITKVNHNISNNNWDTSLSTISIPKTEPYKSIPPPISNNTGNTGGGTGNVSNNITGTLTAQPGQSGKLEPLKSIAAKYESGGKGYGASNTGTAQGCQFSNLTNVENMEFGELKRRMQLPSSPCDRNRVFAAGKYQIIPLTLFGGGNLTGGLWKQLGLTDKDKFTPDIQEKMFLQMILNRTSLGNYLTAKNQGTAAQLSDAVQQLSQLFASMPTIKDEKGNIVGNVELGTGNAPYYLGALNNKPKAVSVRQMSKILIQTRINYSGAVPSYIPPYYTSPV